MYHALTVTTGYKRCMQEKSNKNVGKKYVLPVSKDTVLKLKYHNKSVRGPSVLMFNILEQVFSTKKILSQKLPYCQEDLCITSIKISLFRLACKKQCDCSYLMIEHTYYLVFRERMNMVDICLILSASIGSL